MMDDRKMLIVELNKLYDAWRLILEDAHRLASIPEADSAYIMNMCEENIGHISRLLKRLEE